MLWTTQCSSPAACSLALLLALLCLHPSICQPLSSYTFAASGNSSVLAAPSQKTGMLSVLFNLAPCTALQPHNHNGSELVVAIEGMPVVGFVNNTGSVKELQLKLVSDLMELPTALIHWYTNPTCSMARLLATFPVDTNTQFQFAAIEAIPVPVLTSYFEQADMPPLQGFPFDLDEGCLSGCGHVSVPIVPPGTAASGR